MVSDSLEDRYFFVHCCRPFVCLGVAQGPWLIKEINVKDYSVLHKE